MRARSREGFLLLVGVLLYCGQVQAQTIPSGWSDGDVGSVGLAGSASFANNVFTVKGAGSDVTGTADAFNFVYQPLTGNGTIIARVSADPSGWFSQAGIMFRESLAANATTVFFTTQHQSFTYEDFYDRASTGASLSTQTSTGLNNPPPCWLMLVRSGSTFSAYTSADGINWTQFGSTLTITMQQSAYVGLAVSNNSTGSLGTATFDYVSVSSTSAPAPVISALSATTGNVGTQLTITGTGFGNTQGNSAVYLNGLAATINSWSGTAIGVTVPSGATTGPFVVSVAPSMNDSNLFVFTITSNPLPSGWDDADIGVVGTAGSATYQNGAFTIKGAGVGVAGGNVSPTDAFHFVYKPINGDGSIVARIASLTQSGIGAEVGVMIRETLDQASSNQFLWFYNTSPGAFMLTGRAGAGTNTQTAPQLATAFSPPCWFKLTRTGQAWSAFVSSDGVNWTSDGGPLEVTMAENAYIGIGVASHSPATLATATIDNVSVLSSGSSSPTITSLSTTTGPAGTQVVISGSGFGQTQGGSQVYLNDTQATASSWSDASVTITVPSGATSGYLVVAVGASQNSSNPVWFTVTSSPLPSGWIDQDVGTVGTAGNASFASGVFTIHGAGNAIKSVMDSFHFVYQPLATDGTVVARVVSVDRIQTQAGVTLRSSLDTLSPNAFMGVMYITGSANSFVSGYRKLPGAMTTDTSSSTTVTLPYYVKVVRASNSVATYISPDGSTWTVVGTAQTFPVGQTVYVGLGSSSGNLQSLGTATFDNVSVSLGGSLANPVVTGLSPSAGAPGSTVTITGSGFGGSQSTSTLSFNGSLASVSSWSDGQISAVVPPSASTGPVSVKVANITGMSSGNFTVQLTAQLTDSLNNPTTYVSQVAGAQFRLVSAQGSGCSSCTTRGNISVYFDGNGNGFSVTDALGNTTISKYDTSNNLLTQTVQLNSSTSATTTYTYNSFGEALTAKDALGNVTTNTYDSKGNLLSVTTPSPASGVAGSVTSFAYNSLGELLTITDPLNNVTTLTYYSTGLINTITDAQSHVTTYAYDSHGNRTSVTDANNQTTTFAYDAGDRLTKITYPDSTTTQFAYDYRGRRTSVTDQNGKITAYAYDDADRLTGVTDAANNVTTYAYDTENNLTGITDANSHTTNFSYDAFGRVTKTNFPSTLSETYQYDANNNLTSKTDRKGNTIQYVYDALNRLSRKLYPDSTEVDYVYDLVGKIQSVNDPTGSYSFAYDNMGRLIGTTTSYSFLTSRTFPTAYTYDKASNRTGFTDPESGSTTYAYDTLNRLQTLTPSSAFTASGNFGFSYDALSRRTQMTRPNGVTTNYAYDNLSRLTSVLHQASGSTIDGAAYTVDNAGNRTSKADQRTGVTSNYGYDAIYELTSVTQGTTTTESYTYDPVGNRLSSLGASPYAYNPSNELTSTPTATYTYDANGNTLTKTDSSGATTYAWDFENRLTSVTLPGSGGTVSFKYDPFGRRIYKSSSAGTTIFAYDGDNLIEDTDASGNQLVLYDYSLNIDEPLIRTKAENASNYYVFLSDGLGSITSLCSDSAVLGCFEGASYDSFGSTTQWHLRGRPTVTSRFWYTGRELDSETGLYYYRARYYDPVAGRFLSEDPLGFQGTDAQFYGYVVNSPASLIDPYGLQHRPGGPYHPPLGVKSRCNKTDPCPLLLEKIEINARIVASHRSFDALHGTDHSVDIGNYSRALVRCIKFFHEKCDNPGTPCPQQEPSPEPKTVPVPVPADTAAKAATAVSIGVIIYWIISEGSRIFFPPRNLIPVP